MKMALKWTKLQKEYVRDIEKNLKVVYEKDKTRKDASEFIAEHRYQNNQWSEDHGLKRRPTKKQRRFIKDIENTLGEIFLGESSHDAWIFINSYYVEMSNCFNKEDNIEGEWKKFEEGLV